MEFYCDAMLAGLARWLRAAGHDTCLANSEGDTSLLQAAMAQNRILLTRDRDLARRKAPTGRVLLLESERVPEQAHELKRILGVDWLYDPFTRCVVDNTPLRIATGEEIAAVPAGVRETREHFTVCPTCGRVYWHGDHHRRMRERLLGWQKEN